MDQLGVIFLFNEEIVLFPETVLFPHFTVKESNFCFITVCAPQFMEPQHFKKFLVALGFTCGTLHNTL